MKKDFEKLALKLEKKAITLGKNFTLGAGSYLNLAPSEIEDVPPTLRSPFKNDSSEFNAIFAKLNSEWIDLKSEYQEENYGFMILYIEKLRESLDEMEELVKAEL